VGKVAFHIANKAAIAMDSAYANEARAPQLSEQVLADVGVGDSRVLTFRRVCVGWFCLSRENETNKVSSQDVTIKYGPGEGTQSVCHTTPGSIDIGSTQEHTRNLICKSRRQLLSSPMGAASSGPPENFTNFRSLQVPRSNGKRDSTRMAAKALLEGPGLARPPSGI
jgi:hypothetical protein